MDFFPPSAQFHAPHPWRLEARVHPSLMIVAGASVHVGIAPRRCIVFN